MVKIGNISVSAQHWNDNQCCAIDVETTGLEPYFHEIIEIGILPLDSNFNPRKDILPFHIYLRPYHLERLQKEAAKINRKKWDYIMSYGFDPMEAIDIFEGWYEKLKLKTTDYGHKRVIPLGQNYAGFDLHFMKSWLGFDRYNELFDPRIKDTLITSQFMNDHCSFKGEPVIYPKTNMNWLCRRSQVPYYREFAHDALQDARMAASIYQKMCKRDDF